MAADSGEEQKSAEERLADAIVRSFHKRHGVLIALVVVDGCACSIKEVAEFVLNKDATK